ncbi:O-antigen ligase [Sphingosinicella sp. CPCC 101087]|uniref:O-antigen ligase family protein n=1 Tax=Sphingosinicella sp. CPCC 101087 TaxID=2497754 RepID=UPI00101CE4ED|nr:O-antigen ligase family protein [Sphingosinicella sp. CPCC 101087]
MRQVAISGALAAYMLLCLVLGGASAAGLWANFVLQLLAIPILFASLAFMPDPPIGQPARRLQLLLALMVGLILLQLVPLPPALWTALPGRDHVRDGFELIGEPLPWLPWSLAPDRTIASALWLLPGVAVLLGMIRLGARETWIGWTIVAATALSVLVGALQVAGGHDSPWYFYEITNYGVTVGFFSNANHMATLLVSAIPFLGALNMMARRRGRAAQKSAGLWLILGGLLAIILVGLAINGSLAGLGLAIPVAAATFLLMLRQRKMPLWALAAVLLLAAASVAAVFSGRFDNNLISDEAPTDVVSRYTTFTTSFEAVKDYFPLGSGIGTFRPIYRMYEDPERVTTTYINHVHSDWIEIVLETGLPGLLLLLLFLFWWGRRTLVVWRAAEPDYLARAATIASAAIMAHSLVDYPLRTAAIGAVFAACCAIMASSRIGARREGRSWAAKRPTRHLSAD